MVNLFSLEKIATFFVSKNIMRFLTNSKNLSPIIKESIFFFSKKKRFFLMLDKELNPKSKLLLNLKTYNILREVSSDLSN